MAWRNIWRNPRRTFLTAAAIAFASLLLIFMISFQFGSYETMINTSVKIQAGHIQLQAQGYQDKKEIRQVVPDPEKIGRILDTIPAVQAHTPRATAFALVSSRDRTYGVLVVGIDPVQEAQVSTLANLIRTGNYLTSDDYDKALIGKLLAKNLNINTGDELTILGQGRDGSIAAAIVQIEGIYSSGLDDFDRSAIHIPLKTFQDVFTMQGAVHEVVVIGESLSDVPMIKAAIVKQLDTKGQSEHLVALDWQELMPGLVEAIKLDLISGLIFYGILVLVVAFSILNTFLMAIFERTREFGVMMAIGTTPGRLTKLLLIESISLTALGILAGMVLGAVITFYFQVHGLDFAGSSELLSQFGITGRMYPKLTLLSLLIGPGLVMAITSLAALYPALKIRRLKPVEALTHT